MGTAGDSDDQPTGGGSLFQNFSVSGTGHHIGNNGVINNTPPVADVRGQLERILRAACEEGSIGRDPAIDEEAAAVDVELANGKVDRGRIRSLLVRITEAAGAASAVGAAAARLATAIQSF